MLNNPQNTLQTIIKENHKQQRQALHRDLQNFADQFQERHGICVHFDDEASEALIDASIATEITLRTLCREKFRDFEHGLKIIARNTGVTRFTFTRTLVENPDQTLSQWVVESFSNKQDSAAKA